MPKLLFKLLARFFWSVESSRFSINPAPNVGVGMRKIILLVCSANAKLGCAKVQLPASLRPETVKRSSTPPLGLFGLGLPLESKKNGKRASRVGPVAVIKLGVASWGAVALPAKANCGFMAAPVPPTAGCA